MLLKDNLNRLFKLGLGRANFVLTKKILRNSEGIATNKQRLNFLRRCSTLNVFPKTIENIKVNYGYGIKSVQARSKLRTKRFVLNESIRALRRLIAIKLHKQKQLDDEITSNLPPEIAVKVRFHRYLAYNTASKLYYRRFLKQLEELQNANTAYTDEQQQHTTGTQDADKPQDTTESQSTNEPEDTTQDKVDLVTDLTNGLNTQEINLLSKGPKFSLSPGINEHTTTAVNIAF